MRSLAREFNETAAKLRAAARVAAGVRRRRLARAADAADRAAPAAREHGLGGGRAGAGRGRAARPAGRGAALAGAGRRRRARRPSRSTSTRSSPTGWRCAGSVTRAGETGLRVRSSPERLGQIVDNLVANALAVSDTVTVSARRAGDWVELHVVDDGPGLSAEERARAFDRFWRGRGSGPGSGPRPRDRAPPGDRRRRRGGAARGARRRRGRGRPAAPGLARRLRTAPYTRTRGDAPDGLCQRGPTRGLAAPARRSRGPSGWRRRSTRSPGVGPRIAARLSRLGPRHRPRPARAPAPRLPAGGRREPDRRPVRRAGGGDRRRGAERVAAPHAAPADRAEGDGRRRERLDPGRLVQPGLAGREAAAGHARPAARPAAAERVRRPLLRPERRSAATADLAPIYPAGEEITPPRMRALADRALELVAQRRPIRCPPG